MKEKNEAGKCQLYIYNEINKSEKNVLLRRPI
jgi:hypothetical protein